MQHIIGWDVGGAHLKAARAENGVITSAVQIACPLWLGVAELDRAYHEAEAAIGRAPLNAITMTGELCDAFATREEGVRWPCRDHGAAAFPRTRGLLCGPLRLCGRARNRRPCHRHRLRQLARQRGADRQARARGVVHRYGIDDDRYHPGRGRAARKPWLDRRGAPHPWRACL